MNNPTSFVYGLIDPRTLEIRYIGKTVKGERRIREHNHSWRLKLQDHCARWLKQLKENELNFLWAILEEGTPEQLSDLEKWWVAYGKISGWRLTNLTEGGEGSLGRVHSVETRKKISNSLKGKKLSEERKEKCRLRMLGNTHTLGFKHRPESKQKMSLQRKGLKKPPSHGNAVRQAQLKMKRKWTDEQLIQAIRESKKISDLRKKLNISKTSSYRLIHEVHRLGLDVSHFEGGGWGQAVKGGRRC